MEHLACCQIFQAYQMEYNKNGNKEEGAIQKRTIEIHLKMKGSFQLLSKLCKNKVL